MLNHDRLARRLMRLLWVVMAVVFTALYLLTLPHSVAKAHQDPLVWLEITLQAI